MLTISQSTYIDETAQIGENVEIQPFAYIGKNVVIGDNVKIGSGAKIEYATIGKNTSISSHAVIGTEPQDLGYKGEPTGVIIGENCQIREFATVNRASHEGNTIVGDNCLLMTSAHVAHNCKLEHNVILANVATLGGHSTVGAGAFLGGMVVVHQNVRIGSLAIMSGFSGTRQDIPPFAKTMGAPSRVAGTNFIGLRRNGLDQEERNYIKRAYKYLWFSDLSMQQALEEIEKNIPQTEHVKQLVEFCRTSKRGVIKSYKEYDDDGEV